MKKILSLCFLVCLFASVALAQAAYDIKEMTPAVKAALESRKARFAEIKGYKGLKVIGENNRGYLQVLNAEGGAGDMVSAENRDRRFIYQAIVEQNGLQPGDLETVEKEVEQ